MKDYSKKLYMLHSNKRRFRPIWTFVRLG